MPPHRQPATLTRSLNPPLNSLLNIFSHHNPVRFRSLNTTVPQRLHLMTCPHLPHLEPRRRVTNNGVHKRSLVSSLGPRLYHVLEAVHVRVSK